MARARASASALIASRALHSHECVDEGYQIGHKGKLLTLFSASNYYEEGSNLGAYVKLDLTRGASIHQYQTSDSVAPKKLTLRATVSSMEAESIKQARSIAKECREQMMPRFEAADPEGTGYLPRALWASIVAEVTGLSIRWDLLYEFFHDADGGGESDDDGLKPPSSGAEDTTVPYRLSFLSTEAIDDAALRRASKGNVFQPSTGTTTPRATPVADAIYKNIKQLEAVFRLMDVDDSGALSMDEFTQACEVINRVSEGAAVLSTEQIQDLAEQMDQDKDGVISYNEFLESMRNHRLA